jgi:peptidoglycan LD-endopeptidase LytH
MSNKLIELLQKNKSHFYPVVDFTPQVDKLYPFNFTEFDDNLTKEVITNTENFDFFISQTLTNNQAKFGIGGYAENRVLYQRSPHFDGLKEARSIHLGIDIWGAEGTKVYVPIGGIVHSFAYNNNYGDYGATIILQHQIETTVFHTLYGHLSLADISNLQEGKFISRGQHLAHFGSSSENGNWPPHLHFQIIDDMEFKKGDYPGVCEASKKAHYLNNCCNPDLILNMMQYV